MNEASLSAHVALAGSMDGEAMSKVLAQYGLGATPFAGSPDALYERHLMFDNAVGLPAVGPRELFEAFARSVRDLLSDR
jgi:starch phosphorylase